jgi:hypothetical protein
MTMNENKTKAIAGQLVDLAAKLKDGDALPTSFSSMTFLVHEKQLGLAGKDAETFDEACSTLLQETRWSDKFSETYVADLLRRLLGQLHTDGSPTKAEQLLKELEANYQAYQKTHTVLILLSSIVMHEPALKIGQVTIKKMTPDELRRRLGVHAATQVGQHLTESLANSVVAEFSTVAEPIRAKEIAIEETRRVMDLLRYAIPFIFPDHYKRLGMNVGITGDFAQGEIMAVILPCLDGKSMTFTSESKGPLIPVHVSSETMDKLRECGAWDVAAILAKPVSSLSDFERVLLRGIHWFGNALPQAEPENELLSLVTCLETFLTPRDSNPIGTAIAEGVALLLGKTLDERKKLKRRVKNLYGKRSSVSHGGEKAVLEADLTELREVAKKLVRHMISLNTSIQSQKELLEKIEDQKLT